jgi:protease I
MPRELDGRRIAFLATDGVEQVELTDPWEAVKQAGGRPELVAPKAKIQGFEHDDRGDTFTADVRLDEADPEGYDALVLPGGTKNPDRLRTDDRAVKFVRSFFDAGKPVAAICHGPWTLVEADVVRGRTLTSWPSLQTDIRNAGGTWVDEEVHLDGDLVTSRKPDDLPAFCSALVEAFARWGGTSSGGLSA